MIRIFVTLLCVAVIVSAQTYLDPASAKALLRESPEATFPPLAKQARVQGTVQFDIGVSETGAVVNLKLISGHPLLVASASDAVRAWRYSPYLVEGKTTSFRTTVEVDFSLGIPADRYKREQEARDRFYKESEACRMLLRESKWKEAVDSCKALLPLANSLGDDQPLGKSGAFQNAGYAVLGSQQYAEALRLFQRAYELGIGAHLTDRDAEMAYLYRDLAMAHHGLRQLDEARGFYGRAEKSLKLARDSIQSEELKQAYLIGLRGILKYHLLAAEEANQLEEAKTLRKELNELR